MKCTLAMLSDKKRPFVSARRFTVLKGKQYWKGDTVCFPPTTDVKQFRHPESPDGFYRTVFGPSVPHEGITFCKCQDCESLALRRLTCVRAPTLGKKALAHELEFRACQRAMIADPFVRGLLTNWIKNGDIEDYVDLHESLRVHADDPHPKMKIRVQCRQEMYDEGSTQKRLWAKVVEYKLKPEEFGKPGKLPRMVANFGLAASLQGFHVTAIIKHMMRDTPITLNGLRCEVITDPRPETLISVFEKLIDPPDRGYFALYSDDSCFSIRLDGKVRMFNLDIASCDTSHTAELFELLKDVAPEIMAENLRVLIEQCELPIELRDDSGKKKILLQPECATLYSGSTLTTIINNLANILIFISLALSNIKTSDDIAAAAKRAGYIVTGVAPDEECLSYHQLQFLKHSPVYDTKGQLRAMKNPGVFLRSLGNCKRDLPGRGDLMSRAAAFNKGFIQGTYPSTSITFVEYLRQRFDGSIIDDKMQSFVDKHLQHGHEQHQSSEHWRVDDAEWTQRYSLREWEVLELNETFRHAALETSVSCSAINKILLADYGLGV